MYDSTCRKDQQMLLLWPSHRKKKKKKIIKTHPFLLNPSTYLFLKSNNLHITFADIPMLILDDMFMFISVEDWNGIIQTFLCTFCISGSLVAATRWESKVMKKKYTSDLCWNRKVSSDLMTNCHSKENKYMSLLTVLYHMT